VSIPGTSPPARRDSLRWRLPVLVSALIAVVLAGFVWIAYREVERAAIQAAGERAQAAADQVSALLSPQFADRARDQQTAAADLRVRQFLQDPASGDRALVEQSLRLRGRGVVELWTSDGERLVEMASEPGFVMTARRPPTRAGSTMVRDDEGRIVSETSLEVVGQPAVVGSAPRRGYLVARRLIVLSPPDVLGRLVGNGAVLLGPRDGGQWTNFAAVLQPPITDITQSRGIAGYVAANGERRIGALAEMPQSPWSIWVEFPDAASVALARTFAGRASFAALVFVLLAILLTRLLIGRITSPLVALSRAATSFASGDYSQRVPATRRDEIGQLGAAFNQMADRVSDAHQALEARVVERTQTLDALQTSETRYRAIFEVALDAIITIDADGIVVEFNPAAERMFGYTQAQAEGDSLADLIVPPALREAHRSGLARYVRTGQGKVVGTLVELTAMRSDGSEFPVELTLTPIRVGGKLLITGLVRDITDRKRAAQALLESERVYRSTFAEAPVGIAHVGLDGRFLLVNERLCAVLGYPADALMAVDSDTLQHPDEQAENRDGRTELLAGTRNEFAHVGRLRRRAGEFIWVNTSISLHRDREGRPAYFISMVTDISEQRRLQEQLRQAHKMEAVGRLAGGVAHDFNNLLTAILGFSDLILDDLPPDDANRSSVREIRRAGESAAALTRQLLAFSRQQIFSLEILDVNAVVKRVDGLLKRLIGEDIDLIVKLAPGLAKIQADAGQMEQVILNLVINARDAMPTGGQLTIETANEDLDEAHLLSHPGAGIGPHVMLAISDTGMGMDEATRTQIFEPFFTTKGRGEGTGLGLATVYGIVKQSGGSIWVYSQLGMGTTIKVYFPITRAEAPSETAPLVTSQGGSQTILIAEDQHDVRRVASAALRRRGYTVLEASGGEEALRIVRAHSGPIELLLTDVVMPGMSGRQLADAVQALRPSIRVLFVSGYADDAIVRHGILDPNVKFLQKPFTPNSLNLKVREVLDAVP
jgi:two-component system cell cycle sensor histidine kinase/response regulator CckA